MHDSLFPRVSVTVSVFTAFDDHQSSRPAPSQLHTGNVSPAGLGMGLWVLSRKENEDGAYQTLPDLKRVLPASLVRANESLSKTAHRILRDELGLEASYRLRQSRIFDEVPTSPHPRVISVCYWAFVHIDALSPLLGGRDQVGLELVSSSSFLAEQDRQHDLSRFDGVSRFGLRYAQDHPDGHRKKLTRDLYGSTILDDNHDDMVFYSWRDLRYGFTGRFDPFRFMGSQALDSSFRLSELRDLYDVVRGQMLQPDRFRRMVTGTNGFIQETGRQDSSRSRPGKPGSLFTLAPWAIPDTGYQPR